MLSPFASLDYEVSEASYDTHQVQVINKEKMYEYRQNINAGSALSDLVMCYFTHIYSICIINACLISMRMYVPYIWHDTCECSFMMNHNNDDRGVVTAEKVIKKGFA